MKWRYHLGIWALMLSVLCPLGYAETAEVSAQSAPSTAKAADQSDEADTEPAAKFSPPVNAGYNRPQAASHSVSSSANLLSLMLGLILIVVLILVLGWLARRMGQGGLLGNKHIKLLSAMPLGTRERLVLVDIAGQQLLLGVTPTQITNLHSFDEPVIDPNTSATPSDFSRKLLSLMQQKSPAAAKFASDAEVK